MTNILLDKLSRSSSFQTSKETLGEATYQWENIKTYMYIGYAFASSNYNSDIFSHIRKPGNRVIDCVLIAVISTMSYSFMDFFIKMYTGSLDFNKSLNPLLKGVTYGMLLQTMMFTILYANELTDAMRYLLESVQRKPSWTTCNEQANNCISIPDVLTRCRKGKVTHIKHISVEHYYRLSFLTADTQISEKFFVTGMIWVVTFFIASVTFSTIIKMMRLSFILRVLSSVLAGTLIFILKSELVLVAFKDIVSVNYQQSFEKSMDHLAGIYRIGLIGIYDFNSMSPFTKVDNAVLFFSLVYIANALLRSLIFRIIYLSMLSCIQLHKIIRPHYSMYVLIPMGLEFLHAQRLFAIYMYSNVILSLSAYITVAISTIARLLHSEFRKVKDVYIVGILCLVGFVSCMSLSTIYQHIDALKDGIKISILFLAILKSIIVMWVYGVKRFSTDIEFWLGFKPTVYWKLCWMFLPITLSYSFIVKINKLFYMPSSINTIVAAWCGVTALLVLAFHVTTITSYMMSNNLVAAFRSSTKYGPPDPDMRRSRRKFNDATHTQQCDHNCMLLDDRFDCMHEPIAFKLASDTETVERRSNQAASLTNIFAAGTITKRQSSLIDIKSIRDD